jgi:hypothetical protein
MRRFASVGCGVLIGGAVMLSPSRAHAQQKGPPPKRGQAIEIRGQVPTPQVVTVRPREVPAYDRQILSPAFYDGTGMSASAGGVQMVPESQVRGTTALDTIPAGIAREGGVPAPAATGLAPLQVKPDSMRNAQAAAVTRAGASASEIEAMRRELAVRRARLDSLRRSLDEMQTPVDLGKVPPPAVRRMSAADSAARAQEIESIRRELEYRKQRLDSLQREVRAMGRPRRKPAVPPKSTTPDTTVAPPTKPRGRE